MKKLTPAIKRLLQYSFGPIDWKYDLLTDEEKSIVSETEFMKLKELVTRRCNKNIQLFNEASKLL